MDLNQEQYFLDIDVIRSKKDILVFKQKYTLVMLIE